MNFMTKNFLEEMRFFYVLKLLDLSSNTPPKVTTDKYTVSLVLSKVASNNTLQCTATFADNVLNEMTQLTVYGKKPLL